MNSSPQTPRDPKPLRLLAMVQKQPGIAPHQRFRHEQWAPYLERDHGISLEFAAFESPELSEVLYARGRLARKVRLTLRDSLRRWSARSHALEFDGVVVLREASLLGGPWVERSVVRHGIPLIYDFDDAIWLPDTRGVNGVMALARMPWKVDAICRMASLVTVGNEYLAEHARPFNGNVAIVRTSIDTERYPVQPAPPSDQPFTIVWTGSHSTLAHLDSVRPALEQLAQRRPTRLRVVCDVPPAPFDHVELDFVRWSPHTEARDLAPGHVGIMPIPDTQWTRGKCGCKALQYMAIGRPAVVSPVGINCEIVEADRNGLWASTETEWVDQLDRLAGDAELRARLGTAGRQTVDDGFTAASSAAALSTALRGIRPPLAAHGARRAAARERVAATARASRPAIASPVEEGH